MGYNGVYKNRDGKRVASVTTILGGQLGWSAAGLSAWRKHEVAQGRDPWDFTQQAATLGSVTHELIENWIFGQDEYEPGEGVEDSVVIAASAGLKDYIKWSDENRVEYLESEIRMISEEFQYGGTADGIVTIGGKTILLDFKTSKSLRENHIIQLSAYRQLVEETTDYKIDECIIVKINKGEVEKGESRITVYEIPNETMDIAWEVFQECLTLKKYKSEIGKSMRKLQEVYNGK